MPPERSSTPHQMGTVPLRHTWLAQRSSCDLPGVVDGTVQTTCQHLLSVPCICGMLLGLGEQAATAVQRGVKRLSRYPAARKPCHRLSQADFRLGGLARHALPTCCSQCGWCELVQAVASQLGPGCNCPST